MNQFVDFLREKGLVFKSMKSFQPKTLDSRKKAGLYLGVDLKGYYALVLTLEKKSRVLRKEADELMDLHGRLERHIDAKITKKYLLVKAPLCSKAKAFLEENGWKVWET